MIFYMIRIDNYMVPFSMFSQTLFFCLRFAYTVIGDYFGLHSIGNLISRNDHFNI